MPLTVTQVRSYGRFGDHIPDSTILHCISVAQKEAARYAERVGNLLDHLELMWACHLVSLVDRQPVSVRQDALMISYESLGGDGGLDETSYGREVKRLLSLRVPKVI